MSQTAVTPKLSERFEKFLRRYYHEAIGQLVQGDGRALAIDWLDLFTFDTDLAEDLVEQPDRVLPHLDEALRLYDLPADVDLSDVSVQVENARSDALAVTETRSKHIGEYVAVNGLVKKTSAIHPQLEEAAFECVRCGTMTNIPQSTEDLQEPHECPGCEKQGPFTIDYDQSSYIDHQAVRLQEPPERTKGGEGEHIDVNLQGGLVGAANAGDRADLSGVYRVSATKGKGKTRRTEPYLDGHAVELQESDFEEIDVEEHLDRIEALAAGEEGDPYGVLVESLAPKIHGMDEVKEALVLQMFGGTRLEYGDGTVDRGDSHVLLIGDPGAAKSKLLHAVADLAPRSVFAEGKGLSKAGATAAAVRDDFGPTEWGLEAGALVLANKGVACIDELDKVDEDAVSSLHGALERQVVSVNKAGINATLPAQTAVLAAANPRYGRFDKYEDFADQFDLAPTLISRFDLIFTVTDVPDQQRDRQIAEHVLSTKRDGIDPPVGRDVFRSYVAHAKQSFQPRIEDDAVEATIVDFYTNLRGSYEDHEDSPVPVTARKLEAIVRLAQASARVRLSETVDKEDVERATRLVQSTMRDVGYDPETGQFDADIIETGTSKSQRDRIKSLRSLIEELQQEYASGVPHDELLAQSTDALGINESKAEHEIERLKNRGELYEPRGDGCYRLT